MEIIISIVALIAGTTVAFVVYYIMRQQLTRLQEQLAKTEQNLSIEQEKCKAKEIEVAAKTAELTFERKATEEARKQADEKLAEQIKYLQTELTNTTQQLLDIRSAKLEQSNKTQINSNCIKVLNVRLETIKFLEENRKLTQIIAIYF